MKLHYLQHVPFEGIGCIEYWTEKNGITVSSTQLHMGQEFPDLNAFDFLVVMGGPMGVYDEGDYPWLQAEKVFIKECIDAGKKVIGICLGAQLIADVLGAKVFANKQKEIGWFPVEFLQNMEGTFSQFEDIEIVYQWHGDTFEIPEGATQLATNEVCDNQAFLYNDNALAFQFHLETTPESMSLLIENCRHELIEAPFIQSEEGMKGAEEHLKRANELMYSVLDKFFKN